MNRTQQLAFTWLRCAVSAFLFIHGTSRIYTHGVGGFGDFLADVQGVPAGHAMAVVLTGVEVVGTVLLALGYFVIPLCVWFVAELSTGILMVHIHSGWFVVGGGTNGAEYSTLLIVCFTAIAIFRYGETRLFNSPWWK